MVLYVTERERSELRHGRNDMTRIDKLAIGPLGILVAALEVEEPSVLPLQASGRSNIRYGTFR
jgi:hypothetical protein